ncbi:hypothetical protein Tco_1190798 [Tanacetum coccineum]
MENPTLEEYMTKTRDDYGSGVTRPKFDKKARFELKGQFLKELRNNAFSRTNGDDAIEHIEKFLKILDLLNIPNVTQDQLMLSVFPISLIGAAISKFSNHKMMDRYTKNALWDYWKRCDDGEVLTEDEFSDLEEENLSEGDEIDEIFRIEIDIFDFETPLCEAGI